MKVRFTINNAATPVLVYEMDEVPVKGSFVSIENEDDDSVVYEVTNVEHVFKPTGRGGGYNYHVEVSLR